MATYKIISRGREIGTVTDDGWFSKESRIGTMTGMKSSRREAIAYLALGDIFDAIRGEGLYPSQPEDDAEGAAWRRWNASEDRKRWHAEVQRRLDEIEANLIPIADGIDRTPGGVPILPGLNVED
jgi:hypothetical protein